MYQPIHYMLKYEMPNLIMFSKKVHFNDPPTCTLKSEMPP